MKVVRYVTLNLPLSSCSFSSLLWCPLVSLSVGGVRTPQFPAPGDLSSPSDRSVSDTSLPISFWPLTLPVVVLDWMIGILLHRSLFFCSLSICCRRFFCCIWHLVLEPCVIPSTLWFCLQAVWLFRVCTTASNWVHNADTPIICLLCVSKSVEYVYMNKEDNTSSLIDWLYIVLHPLLRIFYSHRNATIVWWTSIQSSNTITIRKLALNIQQMFTIYILDNDKVVKETSQKRSNTTQNSSALIFDCRKSLEKKNTLSPFKMCVLLTDRVL